MVSEQENENDKKKVKKPCIACGRGFPEECRGKKTKCDVEAWLSYTLDSPLEQPQTLSEAYSNSLEPKVNKHGGTFAALRDPHSTGRKRAAKLYPLDPDGLCEWAGKKNCGGGRFPVVGCVSGKQQARHHGPVKDTTRNQAGNVHRICHACHVHWHELNDLVYSPEDYKLLPHDPDPATEEELAQAMIDWATGEMGRRYELASAKNKGNAKGDYRPPDTISD